jgi:hypothetical protein
VDDILFISPHRGRIRRLFKHFHNRKTGESPENCMYMYNVLILGLWIRVCQFSNTVQELWCTCYILQLLVIWKLK